MDGSKRTTTRIKQTNKKKMQPYDRKFVVKKCITLL